MNVRKEDTERAVNLLKMYKGYLGKTDEKSLRKVIEKLIEILESELYDALIDIHELYEDTLKNPGTLIPQPNERELVKQQSLSVDQVEEVIIDKQQTLPSTSGGEKPKKSKQRQKSQDVVDLPNERKSKEKLPASTSHQVPITQEPKMVEPNQFPNEILEEEDAPEEDNRWEYFDVILNKGKKGYGFAVGGGFDKNQYEGDCSIFITKIVPGGAAEIDGRLRIDDAVISVNDTNLEYVLHDTAVEILKNAGKTMTLVIRRYRDDYHENTNLDDDPQQGEPGLDLYSLPAQELSDQEQLDSHRFQEFEIILTKKSGAGLGFSVNGGFDVDNPDDPSFVYISRITPGGVADIDGRLTTNDVLLMVDDQSLEGLSHNDCVAMLKNTGRTVKLFIGRFLDDIPEEPVAIATDIPEQPVFEKTEKKKKKHRRDRNEN